MKTRIEGSNMSEARSVVPAALFGAVWIVTFAYVVAVGLLVQLYLLPQVVPTWHRGEGLMVRTDSYAFHTMAADLARRIESEGWSAWELRPDGQAPAGIAAAVYVFTAPKPWTLLPLNGALHATAGVVLLGLVGRFAADRRSALVAVLPFIFFPSALRWTTQIHKDGFTILGFLAFVFALCLILDGTRWAALPGRVAPAILLAVLGFVLVWAVRDYVALMLCILAAPTAVLVPGRVRREVQAGRLPRGRVVVAVLTMLGLFAGLATLAGSDPAGGGGGRAERQLEGSLDLEERSGVRLAEWRQEPWMPDVVDRLFRSVARRRLIYTTRYPEAGSNIDRQVAFRSFTEIVGYLPRAAQIALLAPFPADWFAPGAHASSILTRTAAAPEMLAVYGSLLLLPYAAWRWKSRLDFWVLVWICLGMLVGYGLVVANVGTLYRMRYPYIMLIVAISLAAILSWWRERRTADASPANGPVEGSPSTAEGGLDRR
jgi:hypothetical protein